MPVTKENVEAAMNEARRFLERAEYFIKHTSRSDYRWPSKDKAAMMRSGSDLKAALVKLSRSKRDQEWLDNRIPFHSGECDD